MRIFKHYYFMLVPLFFICVFVFLKWEGYRINLTPSYPIGIYRQIIGDLAIGDYVSACPVPSAYVYHARTQGYLKYGTCPGAYTPLLKKVMAMAGDEVKRTQAGFLKINNRILANSKHNTLDPTGYVMPLPPVGIVPAQHVWLMSDYNPASIDSRYLGAFKTESVLSKLEPVWVQKNEH